MIIVTGAFGFIGSNIVRSLNKRGIDEIIAVDDLTDSIKFKNLVDCSISDYVDKDFFINNLDKFKAKTVFHQGACSDTMEHNGKYMMENNYAYSLKLLDWCQEKNVQFIYASSAAVYGGSNVFKEYIKCESPLNIYGYSKFFI